MIYYSFGYEKRYDAFVKNEFSDVNSITDRTNELLDFNLTSSLFAATFDASYKRTIIPDVSNGFSIYIKSKL